MGQPMKLDILFAFFSYAGNGGCAMQLPHIRKWWGKLCFTLGKDDRIGRIADIDLSDTPITMTRNQAVLAAQRGGFDVVVMIDSDNEPDIYLGTDASAKPFFESSFDFLYKRKVQGLPTVIAAPYCGPPPHPVKGGEENVYVFRWTSPESDVEGARHILAAYGRDESTMMSGIAPAGALPTGLSMFSVDAFDLITLYKPADVIDNLLAGNISRAQALQQLHRQGWFYYEWPDEYAAQKNSTEDVTATRDISLAGYVKLGTDVVFCNWDAWAGHHKPKCVGRPRRTSADNVAADLSKAADGYDSTMRKSYVDFLGNGDRQHTNGDSLAAAASNVNADANGHIGGERLIVCNRPVTQLGISTPPENVAALCSVISTLRKLTPEPLRIAEVGSWVGTTALAMAQGCGPGGGEIFCIDHWQGTPYTEEEGVVERAGGPEAVFERFCENVGDLRGLQIKVIESESVKAAETLEPQELHVLHLDGDPSLDAVRRDIRAWLPHLRQDGFMVFSHYDVEEGVTQAVHEEFGEELVHRAGTSSIAYVPMSHWYAARAELLSKEQHV